jgi:hypothetical protein
VKAKWFDTLLIVAMLVFAILPAVGAAPRANNSQTFMMEGIHRYAYSRWEAQSSKVQTITPRKCISVHRGAFLFLTKGGGS